MSGVSERWWIEPSDHEGCVYIESADHSIAHHVRSEDAQEIIALRTRLAGSEARVRELEAENGRLRPALIHTRRMVMAHHSIGECRVCLTESGTTTWDEGDAALRGVEREG